MVRIGTITATATTAMATATAVGATTTAMMCIVTDAPGSRPLGPASLPLACVLRSRA
jgi:hypothetical protein